MDPGIGQGGTTYEVFLSPPGHPKVNSFPSSSVGVSRNTEGEDQWFVIVEQICFAGFRRRMLFISFAVRAVSQKLEREG